MYSYLPRTYYILLHLLVSQKKHFVLILPQTLYFSLSFCLNKNKKKQRGAF